MIFTLLNSALSKIIRAGIKILVLMGVLVFLGLVFGFDGVSIARWVGAILGGGTIIVYVLGAFYANAMIQHVMKDNPDITNLVAGVIVVMCGMNVWKGTPADFKAMAKVLDNDYWFGQSEPMERLVGKDWVTKLGTIGK